MERGRNIFTTVWHVFFFFCFSSFFLFLTVFFQVEIISNAFVNGLTKESFACYFLFDTYQGGREDSLPCQSKTEGLKSEGICLISVDLEESEIDEIFSRKPLFLFWKNCSLFNSFSPEVEPSWTINPSWIWKEREREREKKERKERTFQEPRNAFRLHDLWILSLEFTFGLSLSYSHSFFLSLFLSHFIPFRESLMSGVREKSRWKSSLFDAREQISQSMRFETEKFFYLLSFPSHGSSFSFFHFLSISFRFVCG